MECPTKLYYAARPSEYANQKNIDPFLEELANSGHQVGELAKLYFPGGVEIKAHSIEEQIAETQRLLKEDQVIIFEAAIRHNNLFARVDILIKDGNHFDLIEVKAKSYDVNTTKILNNDRSVSSKWSPYITDVAYQTYVLSLVYPQAMIKSFLMLADKNAIAATSGMNQKFRIIQDSNDRKAVKVSSNLSEADLDTKLLIQLPVDEAVKQIFERSDYQHGTFSDQVNFLSEQHSLGQKIKPELGSKCKKCEFTCTGDEENQMKSGFKECWQEVLGWDESDFSQPNVLEIWNLREKLDTLISRGILKLTDVKEQDIEPKPEKEKTLSQSQRQWLQVEKVKNNDNSPYIDLPGLKQQMKQWVFPLHFIDFETAKPAIPFVKGRHPYELIAFQFSHHRVDADGTVTHAGQYLNVNQGEFPNYDFVRHLRENLSQDDGTIFQYFTHENTTLNEIVRQLLTDNHPPEDKNELIAFIKSITILRENRKKVWSGPRCMVDMLDLVKTYYYDPATHGSNSIKDVLPALLNSSSWLKTKYNKPIYGAAGGISSLNFHDWTWLQEVNGKIVNPYDRLPKLFDEIDQEKLELMSQEDKIQHGGAASTAYARLQFIDISNEERDALCQGLLRYCELDTLAMVMLYEGWMDIIR